MTTVTPDSIVPYTHMYDWAGMNLPSFTSEPSFTAAIRDQNGTRETGYGFETYTDVIEYLYYAERLGPDQEAIVTCLDGGPSFTVKFADQYQPAV